MAQHMKGTIFSLRVPLAAWHYPVAVGIAIIVPVALAYGLSGTVASECYDSLCLLPLLMLIVPPYAAPGLAVLFACNRRSGKPVPDGWLPTIMIFGIVTQVAISLFALATASPGFRDIFFSDLLAFPQGIGVGMTIGAAFWVALYVLGALAP